MDIFPIMTIVLGVPETIVLVVLDVWNTICNRERILVIMETVITNFMTTETRSTHWDLSVARTASDQISANPPSFLTCFLLSALASARYRRHKNAHIRIRLYTAMGLRRNKRVVDVRVRLYTALELLL